MSKFKTDDEKRKENNETLRGISLIMQLGLLMVVSVFVGVFIGIYLDKIFKTSYIYTAIFSVFGVLAAFRNMYIYTMKKR